MPIFNIAKKLGRAAKQFGFAACWVELREILNYKVFKRTTYCLHLLDRDRHVTIPEHPTAIQVLEVPAVELRALTEDSSFDLSSKFLDELSKARVIVAKEAGKTLAYGFFTSTSAVVGEKVEFKLPQNSTYLFKFFVVPEERGKKLLQLLVAKVLEMQDPKLQQKVYTIIIANNFSSLKAFRRLGFFQIKQFLLSRGQCGVIEADF